MNIVNQSATQFKFLHSKKEKGNNEQNFHCDVLHELHSLQRLVTSTCHLYSQCQMKFNNCNYWGFFVTGTTLVYMWTPWKDSLSLSGWLTRSRFRWQPSGQTLLSLKVAVGPILLVTSGQGARYNNKIWVRYIIQSNHLLRSNNFSFCCNQSLLFDGYFLYTIYCKSWIEWENQIEKELHLLCQVSNLHKRKRNGVL